MMVRGLAAALGILLATGCGAREPAALVHAFDSAEALARAVLRGFERRDADALRVVALTDVEFEEHVWPGLPAARAERNLPFAYVWADLRQKSEHSLAQSLARHGGRAHPLVRVEYAGQTSRYHDAIVHRETVLIVSEPGGAEQRLRLYGSTAQVRGRYKVFSYVVDD